MKITGNIYRRLFGLIIAMTLMALSVASTAAIGGVDFLVTNTNDSGSGSLRAALLNANAASGQDTIHFNIRGDGSHTIVLHSPLPPITDAVMIDGTTQPGANCEGELPTLMIEIDGSGAGEYASGFVVMAADSVVRGLVINRFAQHGIQVESSQGGNRFECNFIGTDTTGSVALGNGRSGIFVDNSPNNTIGGVVSGTGNLISGNRWDGVVLFGLDSSNNTVVGNLIGTDVTGTMALGNRNVGVFIDGASYNFVGGSDPRSRNIISANGWEGVYIYKPTASHNIVSGNYIGTDITGTVALGNGDSGIVISQAPNNLIGGETRGSGNIISANGRQGVYIFAPAAANNSVVGNYIGTDATGTQALGNNGSGIFLDQAINNTIGGDEPIQHNLIASNGEYGIYVYGHDLADNRIWSNTFGVEVSGNSRMNNGISDIHLDPISREPDI